MNKPHRHAENMRLYAEDAVETDRPWERWEKRGAGTLSWMPVVGNPTWDTSFEYRRRPKMRRLNDFGYPEPESAAPAVGTRYWFPNIKWHDRLSSTCVWEGSKFDFYHLHRSLIHLSKENAEAHARAIILAGGGAV